MIQEFRRDFSFFLSEVLVGKNSNTTAFKYNIILTGRAWRAVVTSDSQMDLGLRKEVTRKRVTIKDGIILIEREWREEKTNVEMMTMDSRSFSTFMYLIFSVPHSWAHLLLFPHQYKVQGRSWDSNTHNHGSRPSLFNH